MIQRVSVNPGQVTHYAEVTLSADGSALDGFPLLTIGEDSYIVGAEIQSGINFRVAQSCHAICIGKGCSLADGITFIVDLNHNYEAVAQGELSFLSGVNIHDHTRRKGSIILQNDVWIGHGVTIMSGATLHNGAIVAANAVVTKDVPPYAIVGGNPAKVIRYRFDMDVINGLQEIAWWEWPNALRESRKQDFALPPAEFVKKYLPEAKDCLTSAPVLPRESDRIIILIIPDVAEKFPLYPKVFRQFFAMNRTDFELLIYLPKDDSDANTIQRIEQELSWYESSECYVTMQTGTDIDEHVLFTYADYFVTTRDRETIRRTCLCDLHGTKILYGTDEPIFIFDSK